MKKNILIFVVAFSLGAVEKPSHPIWLGSPTIQIATVDSTNSWTASPPSPRPQFLIGLREDGVVVWKTNDWVNVNGWIKPK